MKFSDVQEVREASSPEAANRLLDQGWKLLAIHPARNPHFNAVYILGARTHTEGVLNVPALTQTIQGWPATPVQAEGFADASALSPTSLEPS